jgi:hypothetical protein
MLSLISSESNNEARLALTKDPVLFFQKVCERDSEKEPTLLNGIKTAFGFDSSDRAQIISFIGTANYCHDHLANWIIVDNGHGRMYVDDDRYYHQMVMVHECPSGVYTFQCPYCGTLRFIRYEEYDENFFMVPFCPRCDHVILSNNIKNWFSPDNKEFKRRERMVKYHIFYDRNRWYQSLVRIQLKITGWFRKKESKDG